jgi:maleate cis-trans isomerase
LLRISDLPAYRTSTIAAVTALGVTGANVIVYGCTAAGFLAGPKGDTEISKALSDLVGAPTISTSSAMAAALSYSHATRVDVVTPYLDAVNDGLKAYLEASGYSTATLNSFRCQTTAQLGQVTSEQVLRKALATKSDAGEAMFIACSQLPTLEVLPRLRERLKYPVWSSVQATAWATLRSLDMPSDRLAA